MKFSFIQLIRFLGDNTRAGAHAGIFKGGGAEILRKIFCSH